MTSGEIIEEARDLHPAFDDNSHPDKVLVRFVNRYQTGLLAEALTRYPSLYSTTQDIALPLADFAAGEALTEPLFVQDVVALKNGEETPVVIIPYEHRHDPQPFYCGWIVNRRLFLNGKASNWATFSGGLRVRYATTPAAITGEDDVLILPDHARECLVAACAQFMAGRPGNMQRPGIEKPNLNYFRSEHAIERERFLTNLWLLRSTDARFIRDVSA